MEERQRREKEREIMECVKQYYLKANHTLKKEKSISYPAGSIDYVLSTHVLHHVRVYLGGCPGLY
jgi:hypothetical protein